MDTRVARDEFLSGLKLFSARLFALKSLLKVYGGYA